MSLWGYSNRTRGLASLPAVANVAQSAGNARLGTTRARRPRDGNAPTNVLDVAGVPSLKVLQDPLTGDLVIELERRSQAMATMRAEDVRDVEGIARSVLTTLERMSQGPYTTRDLRKMGHPYGYDAVPVSKATPAVLARRAVPRHFGGKSIGAVKGVRGSVPTLSVVNTQSGELMRSWSVELVRGDAGVVLRWRNSAKSKSGFSYPWALASSTPKMQAHGPFTYAPLQALSPLQAAWARAVAQAGHRARSAATVTGTPDAALSDDSGGWGGSLWQVAQGSSGAGSPGSVGDATVSGLALGAAIGGLALLGLVSGGSSGGASTGSSDSGGG